ncbi:hypothetical protein AB1N83_010954 [Pleurotus pulmonarius]
MTHSPEGRGLCGFRIASIMMSTWDLAASVVDGSVCSSIQKRKFIMSQATRYPAIMLVRYTKDVRRSRGGMCLLGLGIESPERFTPGRSFLCNTSVVGIFATWPWPTVKGPGQVNVDPTSLFVSQCGCIVLAFI